MKLRAVSLLLVGIVTATTSAAQPARPSSGTVDTRQECLALQGAWSASRNSWQSVCEVPWRRDDCLQLGGAWTEAAKAATGGHCIANQTEFSVAQQCLDRGGSWGPQGSPTQSCTFEPRRPRTSVATKAPDAGKLCDSQKDCTYGCVYDGPPVAPKADVMGRCRATNTSSGCYSMVDAGRLAGSVCIK